MGSLVRIKQHGWSLAVADDLPDADEAIQIVLALSDSSRVPFRRSRHARTFLVSSTSGKQAADLFVKYFDPPDPWQRLKSWWRGSRSWRTTRTIRALRAAGFYVPPLLLCGAHPKTRREFIVTARAEGDGPILALRGLGSAIAAKRKILSALGREIGRLHLSGFVHGDLTPFNIRIVIDEPPLRVY